MHPDIPKLRRRSTLPQTLPAAQGHQCAPAALAIKQKSPLAESAAKKRKRASILCITLSCMRAVQNTMKQSVKVKRKCLLLRSGSAPQSCASHSAACEQCKVTKWYISCKLTGYCCCGFSLSL
eukprot:90640-Pelagomonas_calceolata.AAC.2